MITYKNVSGSSGVGAYLLLPEGIVIRFTDGGEYRYTYKSCGKKHIEAMKQLARKGSGLATYINQHVRDCYEKSC